MNKSNISAEESNFLSIEISSPNKENYRIKNILSFPKYRKLVILYRKFVANSKVEYILRIVNLENETFVDIFPKQEDIKLQNEKLCYDQIYKWNEERFIFNINPGNFLLFDWNKSHGSEIHRERILKNYYRLNPKYILFLSDTSLALLEEIEDDDIPIYLSESQYENSYKITKKINPSESCGFVDGYVSIEYSRVSKKYPNSIFINPYIQGVKDSIVLIDLINEKIIMKVEMNEYIRCFDSFLDHERNEILALYCDYNIFSYSIMKSKKLKKIGKADLMSKYFSILQNKYLIVCDENENGDIFLSVIKININSDSSTPTTTTEMIFRESVKENWKSCPEYFLKCFAGDIFLLSSNVNEDESIKILRIKGLEGIVDNNSIENQNSMDMKERLDFLRNEKEIFVFGKKKIFFNLLLNNKKIEDCFRSFFLL